MKYKMVVCDYDDTLYTDAKEIGDYTRKIIAEYIKRGGIFCISSGRNMGSILLQLSLLGLEGADIPLVSLNGTYAINAKTGEVLRDMYIDKPVAYAFCLECERRGLHFHLYDKDYAYVTDMKGKSRSYLEYTNSPALEVAVISDYLQKTPIKPMKMLILGDPTRIRQEAAELEKLFPTLCFVSSNPSLVEVISKESGKGRALKDMSQQYGLQPSEVMAIGDSMNDYSMLEAAGLGVAMGNADPALKKAAGAITDTCENQGVAKAIEKYCLHP